MCKVNNQKELEEIIDKLRKYEQITEIFFLRVNLLDEKKTLEKLDEVRNAISWNTYEGNKSSFLGYPIIVSKQGKNIENQKNIVAPSVLKQGKSILVHEKEIILIFPYFQNGQDYYLLIPFDNHGYLTVKQKNGKVDTLESSYEFSLPIFGKGIDYNTLLIIGLIFSSNFLFIRSYRKYLERKLRQNLFNSYMPRIKEKISIEKKLKEKCKLVFSLQSSINLSHEKLIHYAMKYIGMHQSLKELLHILPLPPVVNIEKKHKTIYVLDVFKKHEVGLNNIVIAALEVFKEDIKRLRLKTKKIFKGKGVFISDEEYVTSVILLYLSGLLEDIKPETELNLCFFMKKGSLIINFSGIFPVPSRPNTYSDSFKENYSNNKGVSSLRLTINPILNNDPGEPEERKRNHNVITLFNN